MVMMVSVVIDVGVASLLLGLSVFSHNITSTRLYIGFNILMVNEFMLPKKKT